MLRQLTIPVMISIVLGLSVTPFYSEGAERFTGSIDGSITMGDCRAIGGIIENVSVIEEDDKLNVDLCKYRNWHFQITPRPICPAVAGMWTDPETGQRFTLPYRCDAPLMPLPNCGMPVRSKEYVFERISSYYNEMVKSSDTMDNPYFFQIGLDGAYIRCEGWEFDASEKHLIIDLRISVLKGTNINFARMNVTIPSSLLGGDFTIFRNGNQTDEFEVLRKENSSTISLPVSSTGTGNNRLAKIEIVATEVIPEFPIQLLILSTAFVLFIVVLSLKKSWVKRLP